MIPRRSAGRGRKRSRRGRSRASATERALDWLNLFVANIQTGFGPFIAVYLTTEGWTQTEIGFALSIGTVTAVASQLPAGALVDASRRKAIVGVLSILAFSVSALLLAVWPTPLPVYLAEVLHGFSSCTLAPVIAAVSLALAGRMRLGLRLGRNARFASVGNGIGALLMGAAGYYISERSVFFLTAALTLPALAAFPPLWRIGGARPRPRLAGRASAAPKAEKLSHVLTDKRLLIFALCGALFTFANAPMLPLASSAVTLRAGSGANLLIAACIVLPQLIVAAISPSLGQLAELRGRRLVLVVGFAMLPLRGLLFALIGHPGMIVLVQALDGISAASFGVMVPLVVADIAGRSGHFNFSLGFIGFAVGIGATFSTTVAGWIADHFGDPAAFVALALVGLAATLLVWLVMPETRPSAAAAGAEAPAAGNVEPIPVKLAGAVLGKQVQGPDGEDMGPVADVIVDAQGRLWALVVDFGAFLGVGSRKIAIDWRLIHFRPDSQDAPLLLQLGWEEIQAAPEYDPVAQTPQMVGPPMDGPGTAKS